MFDIAWSELALIGAVALVVIGPKDLPKVMRTMGQWTRKARLLAGEFHRNVEDLIRESELDEVRRQVQSVNTTSFTRKMEEMVGAESIHQAMSFTEPPPAAGPSAEPAPAEPAVAAPPPAEPKP